MLGHLKALYYDICPKLINKMRQNWSAGKTMHLKYMYIFVE